MARIYLAFNILKVIEPLIEDKTKMGFITEPFTNSLGTWCDKSSPSKLEIKQILTQIMEGVEYLNTECLLVHNNLNPSNIFITKENKIKIGNLSLSQSEGNLINYSFMNKDQLHIKHLSYMSESACRLYGRHCSAIPSFPEQTLSSPLCQGS